MRVTCNSTLISTYYCDDCEKKLDENERKNTIYNYAHFCWDCAEERYTTAQEEAFTAFWEG